MSVLFYRCEAAGFDQPLPALPDGFEVSVWKPRRDGLPPRSLPSYPNAVWWLFDKLGLFANPNCGVIMISREGTLAHSSLVTPRYFRFPEMAADDLQIGATWTAPEMRGQGLAKASIGLIHEHWRGAFKRMWYLVEDDNAPSIRVIEACGYSLLGRGVRSVPAGIGPLATYRMTEAN
ncbi:GNAT family N-acetyltransferase [Caulobacter mirabilis]|uniref:N-acetyltransferase domain-containing protein n=1 Tax=Caulobacter mirabilis TaxID=69666 RepID=A0A2D2AT16_9CAUL|nr:GNAT family protein [Caulobacter mirabilis]ATQ41141.1 hypothetical protein CSW64_01305 [Caulobacter mirabilis]